MKTARQRLRIGLCLALLCAICAPAVRAVGTQGPKTVKLAPGVYQFISPETAGNVDGNSIAIVNDRDVLVFDTNLLPATAQKVLTEIRRITPKPVRYAANSHWHPDHSGGNELYAKAFPDLEIIATQSTRRLMEDTAAVYVKTLEFESAQAEQEIKKAEPTDRDDMQAQLAQQAQFLADYKASHATLPTLTFGDTLTLHHGGREFRFMHLVGHTGGDMALYLPAEKILLTGDLLAYPVPFCADSHPSEWVASLESLQRLDSSIIVPGHGDAQHDSVYLHLVLDSLKDIAMQVHQALHRGLTLAETQKAVKLDPIRLRFTHDDSELNASFEGNFTPIVRQMYDEATEGLELYQ